MVLRLWRCSHMAVSGVDDSDAAGKQPHWRAKAAVPAGDPRRRRHGPYPAHRATDAVCLRRRAAARATGWSSTAAVPAAHKGNFSSPYPAIAGLLPRRAPCRLTAWLFGVFGAIGRPVATPSTHSRALSRLCCCAPASPALGLVLGMLIPLILRPLAGPFRMPAPKQRSNIYESRNSLPGTLRHLPTFVIVPHGDPAADGHPHLPTTGSARATPSRCRCARVLCCPCGSSGFFTRAQEGSRASPETPPRIKAAHRALHPAIAHYQRIVHDSDQPVRVADAATVLKSFISFLRANDKCGRAF